MSATEENVQRPESAAKSTGGWSNQHSWIFLIIIAVGLLFLLMQNRHQYLSPLGLGKAYRIDKLFGSIQEYDPEKGWVAAQLQPVQMPPGGAMEPPSMASRPQPTYVPPPALSSPSQNITPQPKETQQTRKETAAKPEPKSVRTAELSQDEKLKLFQQAFPEFGKDEFQLADDDLYPDWKKINPNGTWPEFLGIYRDFIKWWTDAGSPPEPGFKLWKDFLSKKK
jgi:hypothetical protein